MPEALSKVKIAINEKYYYNSFSLQKLTGNLKYKTETSVDLNSRNHYNNERAINTFMPASFSFMPTKMKLNALQWLQNELLSTKNT